MGREEVERQRTGRLLCCMSSFGGRRIQRWASKPVARSLLSSMRSCTCSGRAESALVWHRRVSWNALLSSEPCALIYLQRTPEKMREKSWQELLGQEGFWIWAALKRLCRVFIMRITCNNNTGRDGALRSFLAREFQGCPFLGPGVPVS